MKPGCSCTAAGPVFPYAVSQSRALVIFGFQATESAIMLFVFRNLTGLN